MGQHETTTGKLVRGGRRGTEPGPGGRSETQREGAMRKKGEEGPLGDAGPGLGATLLRVAWLAVLLGLGMEALLVLIVLGLGTFPGIGAAVADLVRQVSWSVFVCVGLAIGTAVSKLRVPSMGVMGLLAAPAAFAVARFLHQSAAQALAVSGTVSSSDVSLILIALLKGVEYGCLGLVVGWVGQRAWGGAFAHMAAGLAVGVVFGGAIVSLTYSAAPEPLPAAQVVSQGVNEVLFPVGCSLVLFVAAAVARWKESRPDEASSS